VTLRPRLAAAGAIIVLVAAGCGLGAGEDAGDVELTVTRDYGAEELVHESESISESDTVMRVLDRSAEIETRYGGGFVQSVNGLAGEASGGRRSDWFFYVNGIESSIGAADFELSDGDRVWWDYRDWTAAMRVPAVVGSWPEPFLHGYQGQRYEARIICLVEGSACGVAGERLNAAGAVMRDAISGSAGKTATATLEDGKVAIDVIVGVWNKVRLLPKTDLLDEEPAESGVFATFAGPGPAVLTLLNERGEPAGSLGKGAGLVAAVRPDDGPPTWLVTGTDRAGVEAAAGTLGDELRNRYAVAVDEAGPIGVPVP
jgi:hypothetical protein